MQLMGVVATAAFFASLILHELGHAIQARREGVRTEGITLWLFGGVAKLGGEFPSAGAELRIALAGPLVTLVIGSAALLLTAAWPQPGAVRSVMFAWLGYINVALLVFNLVPALPLDGGRVLRALLWARTRDLTPPRIARPVGGRDRRPASRARDPRDAARRTRRTVDRADRVVRARGRAEPRSGAYDTRDLAGARWAC